MNKAEIINLLTEKTAMSRVAVENLVDEFLHVVEKELVKGNEVKISNFGVFYKKVRKARKGTNPSDSRIITIPANNTVGFRPSKSIKAKLN